MNQGVISKTNIQLKNVNKSVVKVFNIIKTKNKFSIGLALFYDLPHMSKNIFTF
ncbi:MAG: hypothetical protein BWY08_02096 [Bacteroidetes bacterium ADurb.Bin174]|jgi:hypothetical protein|nr:MAG: hypothetical protein BWY08_02096 [Bacteroidetes bacterium ADurb.Bin174]